MRYFADLHVHSKYSRATSRDCDLEHLSFWAQRKGVAVVGTGDFTHPAWYDELKTKLVPAEPGLFRLLPELERQIQSQLPKACRREPTRFSLSVEISTIYKKGERTRKIHHLVYAPDWDTAQRFRGALGRIGNIASDGRPILGLDSRHLLEIVLSSGPAAYLVPAHIWTPWFAVLGSKSGFDAVDDCYGDLAKHVFAVETGLSSDPGMNFRVRSLDRFRLVSNSDAHSPPNLAREACVFDTELDFFAMRRALETGQGYRGSIEFFPEEGKYHLDGHRRCGVRLEPEESRALDDRCPSCGSPLTIGVMHRVEELATRPKGESKPDADPYRCLLALPEIMGELLGVGPKSASVERGVARLVEQLGPELEILEQAPLEEIERSSSSLLGEAVSRIRAGQVHCEAGYDGEYGKIRVFRPEELQSDSSRPGLFANLPTANQESKLPNAAKKRGRPPAEVAISKRDVAAQAPAEPRAPVVDSRGSALSTLDPDQRAAAEVLEGPLLIVAGPGTGKTRTLTVRCAEIVNRGVAAPQHLLCVTFTRRAADEIRNRLNDLLPPGANRIEVTTFHGLGLRLLSEQHGVLGLHRGFVLADPDECMSVTKRVLGLSEAKARAFLEALSAARRSGQPLQADQRRYREALWAADFVDFDDLLILPAELLESNREVKDHYRRCFTHVSVDEYQDIDQAQYRLLRSLVPENGNLCVIGDPDQAIYGFRGADVGFFLRFLEDFETARRVELTRSYRSSAVIVQGALQAIARSALVPDRELRSVRTDLAAERIVVHEAATDAAEAEFVVQTIERLLGGHSYFSIDSGRAGPGDSANCAFSDFAVLYRMQAQSRALAKALDRSGIPYQKRGHDRLVDRADVKALLGLLRSTVQQAGNVRQWVEDAVRELDRQNLGLDTAVLLERMRPWLDRHESDGEAFLHEVLLAAESDSWDPRAERVSLLTLHAAKGLEFEVVFLVGVEDGLLPLDLPDLGRASDLDEERRLMFVGMTRAKSWLYLSRARRRTLYGRPLELPASPFLLDIDQLVAERRQGPPRPTKSDPSRGSGQLDLF